MRSGADRQGDGLFQQQARQEQHGVDIEDGPGEHWSAPVFRRSAGFTTPYMLTHLTFSPDRFIYGAINLRHGRLVYGHKVSARYRRVFQLCHRYPPRRDSALPIETCREIARVVLRVEIDRPRFIIKSNIASSHKGAQAS